ncbi:MAG: hypothetical protein IPN71_10515 [Fibrobacteres bacterium]|nr:hypothetical protein [Fibrobacterota bacterium]
MNDISLLPGNTDGKSVPLVVVMEYMPSAWVVSATPSGVSLTMALARALPA